MKKPKKRFQECSALEKIWRYKAYLLIPFDALQIYLMQFTQVAEEDYEFMGFKFCWSIARGSADLRMEYWYTMDEVREVLKEKL